MEKIFLIFGTSNTVGFWDYEGGGWADRLKRYLMARCAKNKDEYFVLYNLGIDGDTTTGVLVRLEQEIKPRLWPGMEVVVIFDVGVNDAILLHDKEPKTPLKQFEENVRQLVMIARKYTKHILFLDRVPFEESKTAPVPWNGRSLYYRNAHIAKYFEIVRKVASEEAALSIEFFDEFEKMNGEHLSDDGLHLGSKGHQKKFEIIRNFLLERGVI